VPEPRDDKREPERRETAPSEQPAPPLTDKAAPADDATPFEPPYMDAFYGSDDFPSPLRRKR